MGPFLSNYHFLIIFFLFRSCFLRLFSFGVFFFFAFCFRRSTTTRAIIIFSTQCAFFSSTSSSFAASLILSCCFVFLPFNVLFPLHNTHTVLRQTDYCRYILFLRQLTTKKKTENSLGKAINFLNHIRIITFVAVVFLRSF